MLSMQWETLLNGVNAFRVELEFGGVGFVEGTEKIGEPGEKPSEQGREPK